jgi:20S proteasome subunit alpha 6
MSESDNMLEILLRLIRGERATPISFSNTASSSSLHLSGPLLTALSPNSPHASQQTHLTLAIVAMVRMAESFADQAMPSDEGKGKREVDERVGEIIRCLPQHLLYKSLDGIFREWKDVKKRGGRG